MNNNQYAFKNALLYTALITIILFVPLYVYTMYMKNIHEVQNELFLKQHHALVISAMEEYDETRESYFEFPRFKSVKTGLYDLNFRPIFTLIKEPMEHFYVGFHIDDSNFAYLIVPLPERRYFDADYLIVANKLSYSSIYQKVLSIALAIVVIVFFLSIFFLNRFSLPYKRVNKQLDDFIKDSMHEINTPLSIININIDLFNRKNEHNKYLQRIKAASKTLSNIYNDMDYLIKNQQLHFEYEKIDLSAFVHERILYFDEVAQMKGIKIISDIEEGLILNFSPNQLQRIIDNNISNAIKYSDEENQIEIKLLSNNGTYQLVFKDYGIGIMDTDMIFKRYYRENSDKGGFGIGLDIVKSIMDEAGIGLNLESTPDKGSSFTYTFPSTLIYISTTD
ncbi:MAG: two-component sensor histidine kinase [Arcobacter sp.]|nr:MAG: two-component sensor histidine kinase [Arcobacter sp.]